MPKSLRLEAYPTRFLELASQFAVGVRMKAYAFGTLREARRFRFDLYGFRAALVKNNMASEYPDFMGVRVKVSTQKPWTVTVVHVDDDNKPRKSS